MHRLLDKVAIVTGAAQGIGRAAAVRLASEGARIVLVDRAQQHLEEVRAQLSRDGREVLAVAADLETLQGVDHMLEKTLDAFGKIDVAVHNVGGTMWTKPFWEFTDDEIKQELNRSLWTTLRCCRAVTPIMLKQRSGSIVNIGSVATRGIYRFPYSAAKGAVHAMTTCMAMELASYNVRVNCVAPGAIDSNDRVVPRNTQPRTEKELEWRQDVLAQTLKDTPLARFGTSDEISSAVAYFASDEASYLTGQIFYVAGGGIG